MPSPCLQDLLQVCVQRSDHSPDASLLTGSAYKICCKSASCLASSRSMGSSKNLLMDTSSLMPCTSQTDTHRQSGESARSGCCNQCREMQAVSTDYQSAPDPVLSPTTTHHRHTHTTTKTNTGTYACRLNHVPSRGRKQGMTCWDTILACCVPLPIHNITGKLIARDPK